MSRTYCDSCDSEVECGCYEENQAPIDVEIIDSLERLMRDRDNPELRQKAIEDLIINCERYLPISY